MIDYHYLKKVNGVLVRLTLLLIIPRYVVTTCETGYYILIRIRSDI